jgi:HlyD family secretion protein
MNYKKLILPILLLAVGVVGFAALKATRPEQSPVKPQERIWKVDTLAAKLASLSPSLTLTGQVESPAQTSAAAPGLGRVVRVLAREGQAVSMGQALVELDNRDFAPRVDQARGQVQELDAAIRSEELRHASDLDQLAQERKLLDFAAADVARFEQLQKENFYSQAAVDQSRSSLAQRQITLRTRELAVADHQARLAQLNARLTQARSSLEQAELALARSRVVAPFNGYVAKVQVAAGDQVNTGQALLTLYPADGLEVRAKIPAPNQEEILTRLGKGGGLKASAEIGGQTQAFTLNRVAGAADARGLDGFFRLAGNNRHLRVGSLVTLHLERAAAVDAIAIPYAALYGGNGVYKLEQGRLKLIEVRVLGERPGDPPSLLVHSPAIQNGDRLLATHLPNATTGLRVETSR